MWWGGGEGGGGGSLVSVAIEMYVFSKRLHQFTEEKPQSSTALCVQLSTPYM